MDALFGAEAQVKWDAEREVYGWLNGLIHALVQRVDKAHDAKTGKEPEHDTDRALWHLHRNGAVLGLQNEIAAEYERRHGPVSPEVEEHIRFMLMQYWMNPYRGDTVWRRSSPNYEPPAT